MHAHQYYYGCHPVPMAYPGLLTLFGSSVALVSATLWGGARVVKRVVEGSLWESHGHCGCRGGDCHCYWVECQPTCGCHSCRCCCC